MPSPRLTILAVRHDRGRPAPGRRRPGPSCSTCSACADSGTTSTSSNRSRPSSLRPAGRRSGGLGQRRLLPPGGRATSAWSGAAALLLEGTRETVGPAYDELLAAGRPGRRAGQHLRHADRRGADRPASRSASTWTSTRRSSSSGTRPGDRHAVRRAHPLRRPSARRSAGPGARCRRAAGTWIPTLPAGRPRPLAGGRPGRSTTALTTVGQLARLRVGRVPRRLLRPEGPLAPAAHRPADPDPGAVPARPGHPPRRGERPGGPGGERLAAARPGRGRRHAPTTTGGSSRGRRPSSASPRAGTSRPAAAGSATAASATWRPAGR